MAKVLTPHARMNNYGLVICINKACQSHQVLQDLIE